MADGPAFPAFLKIVHQPDNSAKASFLAEVASFTTDAKRQFESDFGEIRQVINRSITGFRGGKIALDIDASGLRQTAAEADLTVQKLRLMRDAATSLASSTGDTSASTQRYLSALRAQVIEAERSQRIADAQATTYSRLQAEIDKQVAGNTRLAQSYRDAQIAANLANETYERRGSGPAADQRSGVDRLRDGAASLDRAALSGATLEQVLGRVSSKGVEVSGALGHARKAQDDLARATAALRAELDPTVAAQQRMVTQTELLDRALKQGSIDAVEHARLQKLVGEQYELNTIAAQRSVGTQRALRQATLQSGQQLQDIAISLYSGQQASVVFAQQLPQLAFGLSGLEGSANRTHDRIGRFATFLSGPWGIAVGLAVGVIGSLIAEMLGLGEETDKTKDKTRDFLTVMRDSKASWEEVTKAARDYADQQQKNRQITLQSIQDEAVATAGRLKSAISIREKLKADLEAYESITRRGAQSESQDVVRQGAFARADRTREAIAENQKSLDALTASANEVVIKAADAIANIQSDPAAQIKAGFDVLRNAARSTIKDVDALTKRLTDLNKQEKAAVDAMREAGRSTSSNRQYGREIDVGEARSIAAGAGFRITSGLRSRAEQQRLYDTVRTPQNPVALPGTSAHEKGNALDIAFGTGVSPASIRKAFQDEGVRLTKILKETGHYHIEWSTSGADRAVREAKQVEDYGKRAAETIAQITSRFDEQPRAIDQATAATRELDRVISELSEKRPAGFEKLIADAEKAKDTIQDALVRPIQDMAKESQRGLQIQELVLSGREREASVLQRIWEAQRILGDDLKGQEQQVRAIAEAEYDRLEVIKRQTELQSAYLDATRSVRQEVEAILSGQGKFSNFKQIFRNLQGRVLTEQIFGDVFRDLDTWVKRNTGLGRATDEFTRATDKAGTALEDFAARVGAIGTPTGSVTGASPGSGGISGSDVGDAFPWSLRGTVWDAAPPKSVAGASNDNFDPNAEIVVVANKGGRLPIEVPKGTIMAMSPKDYVDGVSAALGKRFLDALNSTFGTSFFSRFQGVLSGAAGGYVSGGIPGGIIGAIKGIDGLPKELSKVLGKAGEGAATGTATAGIMKMLGIKTSTTGAQIGGAIGSAIPIPGGEIIGSIIGGLVGGLFKKAKTGTATIGNLNGALGITGTGGSSSKYIKAAGDSADSVLSGIERIAQALGASVNASAGSVSIGYRDGKVRVDTSGRGATKVKKGAVDFGKDGLAEAIQYATLDLIKDGVLTGLRQGTQTLLKNAKDLDTGLQRALDFESVFAQLKAIKDPVGAALDGLDKEFVRLQGIFKDAGASTEELASLEELYGLKRVDAVKQANEQIIGSMKSLLSDLKTGDNGLSLKDREAAARAAYDPLAARVRAGDVTAADDFTTAARTLLDLERQIYGSQQPYFDFFNEVKTLSQTMVDTQEALATASANRDSPFSKTTSAGTDNASVVSAIVAATSALVSELKAANDNLISILQKLSASGVNLANGIPFGTSF